MTAYLPPPCRSPKHERDASASNHDLQCHFLPRKVDLESGEGIYVKVQISYGGLNSD